MVQAAKKSARAYALIASRPAPWNPTWVCGSFSGCSSS